MQEVDPNKKSATDATTTSKSFIDKLAEAAEINLARALENTYNISVDINKTFGQNQERLVELMGTVSEVTPRISRLGGGIKDVEDTISAIAETSRRNVIANTEDVEKLYAATRVLGQSATELSDAFLNVGVGTTEMTKQLESSVQYIQSIGGNTNMVMKDVTKNMDQMNRYQFEGGVKGLTKMAAQASMLRFDMSETFAFAEKVLDPEGAVDTAAAFQRLGVSAGNLADPFQLMNQSINDPSGLQNSLAEVSRQFTYFDEETKSFKINPQGVLTLREMEKAAGLSQGSLSKMGLAAAELDARLSDVSMAGLTFANEEDKQYLANIAKMGKGGKYEVELNDGTKKELSQLNQDEFNELIEQQKTSPKTLEDIAKAQLKVDEDALANLKSISDSISQGLTSPRKIRQGVAGAQRAVKTIGGETSDAFKVDEFRSISDGLITNVSDLVKGYISGNQSLEQTFENGFNRFGGIAEKGQEMLKERLLDIGAKIAEKLTNQTSGESYLKEKISNAVGNRNLSNNQESLSLSTNRGVTQQTAQTNQTVTTNSNVDVGGKITVEVKSPAGVSPEDLNKVMTNFVNSQEFQSHIRNITKESNPTKEPTSTVYGQ